MILQKAVYLRSAPALKFFPDDTGREIVFAGRSNAGKSTAINCLTSRAALARVSKTPGRTQCINFFSLNEELRLVDLPGYGFAKVPPAEQASWKKLIEDYFSNRQSLKGIVVLVDIRRLLTPLDEQMLEFVQQANLGVLVLLTKADKLNKSEQNSALFKIQKELKNFGKLEVLLFSALKKTGVVEAREWIENMLLATEPLA